MSLPWSVLQPDTIKAVIHDLGLAQFTSRTARKNDLVKLLQSIELEGLSSVRRRLQAERDEPSSGYVRDREREESPELEYSGPAPSTSSASAFASISAPVRPIVEIPVHVHGPTSAQSTSSAGPRAPRTRAKGKARARPSPSELESDSSSMPPPPGPSRVGPPKKRKAPLTGTSARVGPSSRKRARPQPVAASKLPPIDLSHIPPPSYAILYQQRHNVSQPRREPWPRLNPHEAFAGVDVPLRRKKRPRVEDEGEGARNGGASQPIVIEAAYGVDGSEELGGAARGRGTRGASTGTGTGTGTAASTTASVTRRMEAVVVSSSKTLTAKTTSGRRRKTIVISDDEV